MSAVDKVTLDLDHELLCCKIALRIVLKKKYGYNRRAWINALKLYRLLHGSQLPPLALKALEETLQELLGKAWRLNFGYKASLRASGLNSVGVRQAPKNSRRRER